MPRSGPVTKDTSTVALGLAQIRVGPAAANITLTDAILPAAASVGALANTKYTGNVDYWKLESGFPMLEDLTLPIREASMLECAFKELSSYNLAMARGIDPTAEQSASVTTLGSNTSAGTTPGTAIAVTDDAGPVSDTFTVVFSDATNFDIYGEASGDLGTGTIAAGAAPDNGGNPYFTIAADYFAGTWAAGETHIFETVEYFAGVATYSDVHAGEIKLGALTAPAFVRMEAWYTFPNQTNHMYIIFPRANVVSSIEVDLQTEDAAAVPITFEAKRADSETTGGNAAWDTMPLGRIYFD